jgi:uncharacterized protein YndB with AHSA1/START domain
MVHKAAALEFEFGAVIRRSPEDVFAFFRDVDRHAAMSRDLVPVYRKLTPGPVRVGTRYHEEVQLLPLIRGKIENEVTELDPPRRLAYRFVALGMDGGLSYDLEPVEGGTRLKQRQRLCPAGPMRLAAPVIRAFFSRAVSRRLQGIQEYLDSGGAV